MRVEPAPFVFRNEDRRRPFDARRTTSADQLIEQPASGPRASHAAHPWMAPAFGAHLLGQIAPETVTADRARRAYSQPEARTPLRPRLVKSA